MDELLDAIAALVSLVSPEKVQAIAAQVRRTDIDKAVTVLPSVVGTPIASAAIRQLVVSWKKTQATSSELASMLVAASYVHSKMSTEQSVELVWTGPTTPFVSARRTEQALLQVINSAKQSLFITSFVAYDVESIVKALMEASERGVSISMLLELSQAHGGSITFDAIGNMKELVPASRLYAWREKADLFADGRVHAKVAVADSAVCFITSANLTGYAMEKNMEAGVLITGGQIPTLLEQHLQSLVSMQVVSPI